MLSVLPSAVAQIEEERLFREYVCESLSLLPQKKYITAHFRDLFRPRVKTPEKAPDEIAREIVQKAGLTVE